MTTPSKSSENEVRFPFIPAAVFTPQVAVPYPYERVFGIMVTVVWLYLEILRLVSYFLPRN